MWHDLYRDDYVTILSKSSLVREHFQLMRNAKDVRDVSNYFSEALRLAISELRALHGCVKSYQKPKGDSVRQDKPPINVWYNDRCHEAKRRYTQCAVTRGRGSEAAFQELKRCENIVKAAKHSWMKACDKERMNNSLKAPKTFWKSFAQNKVRHSDADTEGWSAYFKQLYIAQSSESGVSSDSRKAHETYKALFPESSDNARAQADWLNIQIYAAEVT
jgi:hypothetical protein